MLKLEEPIRSIQGIERLLKKYVDDRGADGWDPLYGEGIVNIASLGIEGDEPISDNTPKSSEIISLPEHNDVPLNKKWTIEFNRILTEWDNIDVKIFEGVTEIPFTFTLKIGKKEIIVSSGRLYRLNTEYRLVILVGKGKKYEMRFVTTNH